jgi:hypothetical protein
MKESDTTKSRIPASNADEPNIFAEITTPDLLNPYRPEDLWIDPAKIHAVAATKKIVTTIPVRKPNKHEFFRVHPAEEFWRLVALLEWERNLYVIHPAIVPQMDPDDIFYAYLCLAVSVSGQPFFWPVKVSKPDRTNQWNDSALLLAKKAIESWVKIRSRQEDGKGQGHYAGEEPIGNFGKPVWPELTQKQLYDIAFKDGRIIDRVDHLVIQKLTGQVK